MAQLSPNRTRRCPKLLSIALAGFVLATGVIGRAAGQDASAAATPWTFRITPYLWTPSFEGQLRYGLARLPGDAATADISIDAGTLLRALNFGAMLAAEARRDRFSVVTDVIYLHLSDKGSRARSTDFGQSLDLPVAVGRTIDARSSLKMTLWGLAAGYTLAEGGWGHLDVTAGFRLLAVDSSTDVQIDTVLAGPGPGSALSTVRRLGQNTTLFDGVAGLRGQILLGGGFSLPYAFDIGGGSANLTWQAMAGLAYRVGWADFSVGYRALHYEQGSNKLLRDLTLSGPFLAATFRF
jgi:hypothetical protein